MSWKQRLNRSLFCLCIAALGGAASRPATARPVSVNVDVNLFHDDLAPYGDWVQSDRYGQVWAPRTVSYGWRPYQAGHWAYTEYGWTWISDEEFGWATYHYGRWAYDQDYGWIWVPGQTWGPAWVAWRHGGGYTGWAPLPPEADDVYAYNYDGFVDPHSYNFVEDRYLPDPRSRGYVVPVARNATILSFAVSSTHYSRSDDRVFNHGVDVAQIERVYGRPVPRYHVRDVQSPREARVRGGDVNVYRALRSVEAKGWRPSSGTVARPPSSVALDRGYAQDQQRLAEAERNERNRLRVLQDQEARRQGAKITADEMRARREAEQKIQAEHEQRQRQVLDARYARERKLVPQAPPPAPPPAKVAVPPASKAEQAPGKKNDAGDGNQGNDDKGNKGNQGNQGNKGKGNKGKGKGH